MTDVCSAQMSAAVQCAAQDFTGQCMQCIDLGTFSTEFQGQVVQKFASGQAFAIPGTSQFCSAVNQQVCDLYQTSYSCCDTACGEQMAAYRTCIFEQVAPQQLGMSPCTDTCGKDSGGDGGGVSVGVIGGVAGAVVALVVAVGVWWYMRRRRAAAVKSEGVEESPTAEKTGRSCLACCFGGTKEDDDAEDRKAPQGAVDPDSDNDSDSDDEERGSKKNNKTSSTGKKHGDDTSSSNGSSQELRREREMAEAKAKQAAQQKRLQELQEQQRRLQQEQEMRIRQHQQQQLVGRAQPSKAAQMDSRPKKSYDSDSDSDSERSVEDKRAPAPAPSTAAPAVSSSAAREKKHAIEEWNDAKRNGSNENLRDYEEKRSAHGTSNSRSAATAATAAASAHSRTTSGGKPKRISSRDLNQIIQERSESILRVNELEDEKAEMEDRLSRAKREAEALRHERELSQKRIEELEALNRKLRSEIRHASGSSHARSRSRSRSNHSSIGSPSKLEELTTSWDK